MVEIAAFIIVAYVFLVILGAMIETGCLGAIFRFFGIIIIGLIIFVIL